MTPPLTPRGRDLIRRFWRPVAVVALAALAGALLTRAGWHPLALSDQGAGLLVVTLDDPEAGPAMVRRVSAAAAALAALWLLARRPPDGR